MDFEDVISQLRRVRPNAEMGQTAQRGKYYDQAVQMTFRRVDELTYSAQGSRGKTMWLYVNEKLGRICCGNKG